MKQFTKTDLENIINHYGLSHQLRKLHEEIYEVTEAILNREHIDNISEEIADVFVVLEQLRVYHNINSKQVTDIMNYKVKRTIDRMNNSSDRV